MIINYKKFDLWGKALIETISIKPPYRLSVNFPQQACFIYYKTWHIWVSCSTFQVLQLPGGRLAMGQ